MSDTPAMTICVDDQEHINATIKMFRNSLENLYVRGYLQGQIDLQRAEIEKMKEAKQ